MPVRSKWLPSRAAFLWQPGGLSGLSMSIYKVLQRRQNPASFGFEFFQPFKLCACVCVQVSNSLFIVAEPIFGSGLLVTHFIEQSLDTLAEVIPQFAQKVAT